ncbi:NlpC/P60 family protein [Actinomadura logoneensis]|uniref:NlpC/P60 family protein n=1 Tax=Actinomadura logoneensis TaxID=2293572 RepID=A0A372JQV4_9ACTN|nr:C40 family peptidase [Actinomadura logoneensis]RFU41728.1 NlpC/P60 family protein [Actinomadura logoneensis]
MAKDPQRRRVVLAAATVLALGLGVAAPGAAHAAPTAPRAPQAPPSPGKPSESDLKKQLQQLQDEAEKLTEQYNKSRVELGKAQKAERDATRRADALEAQAAPARAALGRVAANQYMSGGGPDVIFAGGGTDGGGLSDTAYLAQNRAGAVQRLQTLIDQANKAKSDAQAQTAKVKQAADQADAARKTTKGKIDQVQKLLDKLNITRTKDPTSGYTVTVRGSGLPQKMLRKALGKLGSPYVWAAAGPTTFDCSGLVIWAYDQVGKPGLPHYTGDLFQLGHKVDRGSLRQGDLVYFGGNLHHMGIYAGNGLYLHAPQTGDVVKVSKLSDRSDFAGANRIE